MAHELLKNRLILGLLILGLMVALCAYYAAEYENHLDHPSYRAILSDYPEGEVVYVYGTVVRDYPGGYEIQENYHDQLVTLKVHSDSPVAVGDDVSIQGVLGPDYHITSVEKIFVNQKWKFYLVLLRSFLAFIVLGYLFHRYWQLDREKFMFRRR